jgi:hypothetical protein
VTLQEDIRKLELRLARENLLFLIASNGGMATDDLMDRLAEIEKELGIPHDEKPGEE